MPHVLIRQNIMEISIKQPISVRVLNQQQLHVHDIHDPEF
jgi:hypothetical protein